jgi:hypothetical protein
MSETPVKNWGEHSTYDGFGNEMPGDLPVHPDLTEADPKKEDDDEQ